MSSNPKVMQFTGKRTQDIGIPRHLRIDPDMKKKIVELAEANDRPIGSQIVRLIRIGIEAEEKKTA